MGGASRVGRQEPTFERTGPYAYTMGPDAVALFGGYGVGFYPSQAHEMDLYLARDEEGAFAGRTICLSKPRQNGKSFAARFYALWMAAVEGKRVLYSAHHGKTTRKMFEEMKAFVLANPDFSRLLMPGRSGVHSSYGREGVYFSDGRGRRCGMVEFQTRTNAGPRGETYQVIIVDEAQELTDAQMEGLKPTTIAAGAVGTSESHTQMIMFGTPPNEACPGTVFARNHDLAHAGVGAVWWAEWAAEAVPPEGARFEDVLDEAYRCNPAMGIRISEQGMRDAFEGTSRAGFAREYLGWWRPAGEAGRAIARQAWERCAVREAPTGGVKAFGVKFEADGRRVAVAAARRFADGSVYVELVGLWETERGLRELTAFLTGARLMETTAAVAVDGKAGAGTLLERLARAGWPRRALPRVGAAEVSCAAATMAAMVAERTLTHWGDPAQEALDASVAAATRRRVGRDGWAFDGDCVAVEAASLAAWAAINTRRDPGKGGGIGC